MALNWVTLLLYKFMLTVTNVRMAWLIIPKNMSIKDNKQYIKQMFLLDLKFIITS